MAPVVSNELLQKLRQQIVAVQYKAEGRFGGKEAAALKHTPLPGKWSALQCLEHLNSYGRFYLPALEKAIAAAEKKGSAPTLYFKSSWLGAWFTRLMEPGTDGELRSKMKSPKDHQPGVQPDEQVVMNEFIQQQEKMEKLLLRAGKINLQHAKVTTSLSRFIKMSAGDTFSFLTAHINRHVLQAEKAINSYQPAAANVV